MPTLHKFKFLAAQCAVAGSPTRSPTTSPVIHLRRRKTLRMFLARRRFQPPPQDPPPIPNSEARVRHKLKDLFISSPPPPPPLHHDTNKSTTTTTTSDRDENHQLEELVPNSTVTVRFCSGSPFRRNASALRPVSSVFRYRFLRRAWRPVLVTIPE